MKDWFYRLFKIKRKVYDADGVMCFKGNHLVYTKGGIFKLKKHHIDFIRKESITRE